jgi:abequosyltransferase
MSDVLLSICIPTFNRARFLKRTLDSIFSQTVETDIELFISDNASTDNTEEIVAEYRTLRHSIRYVRNSTNLGPDVNVARCFEAATGRYVMVFGDDDILLPGSLDLVLRLIKLDRFSLIYLNYFGFQHDLDSERPKINLGPKIYSYHGEQLLKKIRANIGFISAYVAKRSDLRLEVMNRLIGTNLGHVAMLLDVAVNARENAYIGEYLLAQQGGNSGGYNYFKVLGKNYFDILTSSLNGRQRCTRWIFNESLSNVYPWAILQVRLGKDPAMFESNGFEIIKPLYRNYAAFWLFVYPIAKLPMFAVRLYFFLVKIVAKILYHLRRLPTGNVIARGEI